MRWIYSILYPVAFGSGILISPFSKKIRRGFLERHGLYRRLRKQVGEWKTPPLWFHVSSSGELEQCLPILDEIKRRKSDQKIFLSFYSPTAKRGLELEKNRRERSHLPIPWDYADYSPFDFRSSVRRFLDLLKPTHFISINREIWPNLLEECQHRKIPCYLFATFFSLKSQKGSRYIKTWLHDFQFIGTSQEETTAFLKSTISGPKIETLGDPRVERVLLRKGMQKIPAWASFFEGQRVMILASLWKEDFEAISEGIAQLSQRPMPWRLVIAPHEPEERFLRHLSHWFSQNGLRVRRWSHWLNEPDMTSHLLIDKVGELAELYRVGTLVFVGGSFKNRVHNVLEPAAYAKPIVTGPFIQNSIEALEMSRNRRGLFQVDSRKAFNDQIAALASDEKLLQEASCDVMKYLESRLGASKRYADLILDQ